MRYKYQALPLSVVFNLMLNSLLRKWYMLGQTNLPSLVSGLKKYFYITEAPCFLFYFYFLFKKYSERTLKFFSA